MSDKAEIEKIRARVHAEYGYAGFNGPMLARSDLHALLAALDAATAERREWDLRLVEFAVFNAGCSCDEARAEHFLAAFEEQEKARG